MKDVYKLIIAIIIPISAGALGSIFTSQSVDSWYLTLNKPALNPPSWVFGPVWTFLFILMGSALYILWRDKKLKDLALYAFVVQMILNIGWSYFFFELQQPLYAFIEILFLWAAIALTLCAFYKKNKVAGWLLIPYIAWVTFAAYLNLMIVILN